MNLVRTRIQAVELELSRYDRPHKLGVKSPYNLPCYTLTSHLEVNIAGAYHTCGVRRGSQIRTSFVSAIV